MKNIARPHSPLVAALAAMGFSASALAIIPSSSPYYVDPQNEYVHDATSGSIGTVNMIMCFMGALRPNATVNQGNYVALADESICQSNKSNAFQSGGSNGSQSNYMRAIVNSTRTSSSDPMQVKIWFENETRETALRLSSAVSTDSGSGAVRVVDTGTTDSLFSYNSGYFYRSDGTTNYCFDRAKANAASSVWRYGLYDSSGWSYPM